MVKLNLFDSEFKKESKPYQPLALRMRPRKLEEFVGQEEIVGEGTFLKKAIEEDKLVPIILYGPPGSGKTSLAKIIAEATSAYWEQISAVTSGVAEVRKVIEEARERFSLFGQRTILFIDEIHRFNKAQQDVLLPAVEEEVIILIGATTENPYFEINSPLISRSKILPLKPLSSKEIELILKRALKDRERGLGKEKILIEDEALQYIIDKSNGDGRVALNTLETAVFLASGEKRKKIVNLEVAKEAIQRRSIYYDKDRDIHYDTISAFIKSLRGSDPDAAIYYLARMLRGGEDPRFIARRMIIFASEDIGNADPRALTIATSAFEAVEFVGMPECRLNLAQAAIYLATAPKSNSVIKAIDKALEALEEEATPPIPDHLKDSHYPGAKKLGHGKGYKYPHVFPHHYVEQPYLPENLKKRKYYFPSDAGYEKKIKEFLRYLKEADKKTS